MLSTIIGIFNMLYIAFFVVGAIVFFNLLSKAFNKSFLSGVICILFPVGTYVYCKKDWDNSKPYGITIAMCTVLALIFRIINYIIS